MPIVMLDEFRDLSVHRRMSRILKAFIAKTR